MDGCAKPVIGRGALIKNERAAGSAQDIADVKALDTTYASRGSWQNENAESASRLTPRFRLVARVAD